MSRQENDCREQVGVVSTPKNVQDQTTTLESVVNLLHRIEPLTHDYEVNRQKQNNFNTGFNLFELISDHYYRETFHSDILHALLDPNAKHGEKKYLQLFLEFLNSQHGTDINPLDYSNAQVEKEKDKIDIRIKGLKHAIIIENKIYDAPDQPRQLPDYLKKIKKQGYDCDAIIYLRLNRDALPDTTGWTEDEKNEVRALLKPICAYDGTGDGNDLLKGWILACENESKKDSDAQFILRQYGKLIKKLGINIMNKPIMDDFYKIMIEDNGAKLKTALSLPRMMDDLVKYRAGQIRDKFKCDPTPFNEIKLYYNDTDVCFILRWNNADFHLDIAVKPDSYSCGFGDYASYPEGVENKAGEIVKQMGHFSAYKLDDRGRFCREFAFPSQQEVLIEHIRDFKKKLDETIKSLLKPVS